MVPERLVEEKVEAHYMRTEPDKKKCILEGAIENIYGKDPKKNPLKSYIRPPKTFGIKGPPGSMKTTLGMKLSLNYANKNPDIYVVYCPLEQSPEQLLDDLPLKISEEARKLNEEGRLIITDYTGTAPSEGVLAYVPTTKKPRAVSFAEHITQNPATIKFLKSRGADTEKWIKHIKNLVRTTSYTDYLALHPDSLKILEEGNIDVEEWKGFIEKLSVSTLERPDYFVEVNSDMANYSPHNNGKAKLFIIDSWSALIGKQGLSIKDPEHEIVARSMLYGIKETARLLGYEYLGLIMEAGETIESYPLDILIQLGYDPENKGRRDIWLEKTRGAEQELQKYVLDYDKETEKFSILNVLEKLQ